MAADGEGRPRRVQDRQVQDRQVLERVVERLRSDGAQATRPDGLAPPVGEGRPTPQAEGDAVPMRAWAAARRATALGGAGLPAPPAWASRSVVEDGGVTHELVSDLRPMALVRVHGGGIALSAATEVSVSIVDRPRGRGWVRQSPRIQVEGGSYPLAEARLLVRAIESLIDRVR